MVHTRYPLPDTTLLDVLAQAESIEQERLVRLILGGRVVVPQNPKRDHLPCAIGQGCRVKVNVNVGTSQNLCDPALEKEKAEAAIQNGAHTLMDLSTGGDLLLYVGLFYLFQFRLARFQYMRQYEGRFSQ
jgi:phosphomethylpyrimidine synthase